MEKTPQQEATESYHAGVAAKAKGDLRGAYELFTRCVELDPGIPAYRINLSVAAYDLQRPSERLRDEAVQQAQMAAKIDPHNVGHWMALGEISVNCNKFAEGVAAYEKAIEMLPTAVSYGLLGFAYARLGNNKKAIENYKKSLELNPDLGDIHFLMSCEYSKDNFNPAKQAYHGELGFASKKASPLSVESCWNAAHGFLTIGNYGKGWAYFESRLRRNIINQGNHLASERYPKPLWRGEMGCRVRVHAEMGYGDVFLMMRYLKLLKSKFNVDAQFEAGETMRGLCRHNFPGVEFVPEGDQNIDQFDFHLPMMSLPYIFGTRNDTVPWSGGYLLPEPDRNLEWYEKLKLDRFNVGICWFAGQRSYNADNHDVCKRKSVNFDLIKPLLKTKGVNFVSLQAEKDSQFPHPGIQNFSDTAAIISLMDLVITVDTSVANLAGAMGKETWLMDRFDHCWRYSDIKSPWYPTVRVFRQTTSGDWNTVITKIQCALSMRSAKLAA